jgi:hypothetical protein
VSGRSSRLILAVLLAAACGVPVPSVTPAPSIPPAPSGVPATPPVLSPAVSPAPTLAMTSFSEGWYSFEYPSEWPVIAENVFNGADRTPIVVGTGAWSDGCARTQTSVSCSGPVFRLDPGEVVVEVSYRGHGPAIPVFGPPPFDARILEDGVAAEISDVLSGTRVILHVPGTSALALNIKFGSPATDADRAMVAAIVDSFQFGLGRPDVSLTFWTPPSGDHDDCEAFGVEGRLGRGDFNGINLLTPAGSFVFLVWPDGWSARIGADGRLEILDASGDVAAHEWDQILIGGRGDQNEFRVCPDAVQILRRFPTT